MLTSGSLINKDTISFNSNENKMAAITAFWNRRGVVGSHPTDPQLNSSRESADTGKLLPSCYGRLILCIRFWLSGICLNTLAYILRSFYNINLVTLLLITLTSTLIILYIKESESINDCLIIHYLKKISRNTSSNGTQFGLALAIGHHVLRAQLPPQISQLSAGR